MARKLQKRSRYYCICEGQQEEMYLDHIASLVKIQGQRVLTFEHTLGLPQDLRKTNYREYDTAVFFDHDGKQTEFEEGIRLCQKANKPQGSKKASKHTYHAYSNINFDLWLVLHKKDCFRPATRNNEYVKDVRELYGLSQEADIKEKAVIKRILDQITLEEVIAAIQRAEKIRTRKEPGDGKDISGQISYSNPDFSVHEFLKSVLIEIGCWPINLS